MGGGDTQQFAALCRDQRAWLHRVPIRTEKVVDRVANRTATQAETRESTETTHLPRKGTAASFLSECLLFDDFATREIDGQRTATHRTHLSSQFRPLHRLPVEPGICDVAQGAPGGG